MREELRGREFFFLAYDVMYLFYSPKSMSYKSSYPENRSKKEVRKKKERERKAKGREGWDGMGWEEIIICHLKMLTYRMAQSRPQIRK